MLRSKFQVGALWGMLIVLVISIGFTTYLIDRHVRLFLYDKYVLSLKTEADSFELALQQGLILNDFNLVQQLLTDLGLQRSVSAIRLLSSSGVVRASSIEGEIGIQLDYASPSCKSCHSATSGLRLFHQVVQRGESDETNILIANSLDNRVTCQGCHTEGKPTLGVILVEYDAQNIFHWQRNFSLGVIIGGSITLLILFGALGLVFHSKVTKPLQSLESGLPQDDLLLRPDEIGTIARRLSNLEELQQLYDEQAAVRRMNFRALISISESLDENISIEGIYRTALSTIQEVTGFSSVGMRFYDASHDCFHLIAHHGMSPRMVNELQCITPDAGLYQEIMRTKNIVFLSTKTGFNSEFLQIHASSQDEGFQTVVCVPFLFGERILGSMELGSKAAQCFSEDQIRWMEVVGRVIGSLIHQVELRNRLQSMAMKQERAHVAQEIHDGLVQMLGSLRLWAEEAQIALDEQDSRALQSAVRKIETTSSDAYSSLREEMLGLRDTLQTGKGILPVLREFLARFQRQWGIETRLLVKNQDEPFVSAISSPAVEVQLLRMIQEGLNNVRRHSRANAVEVSFQPKDHKLIVGIHDNGTGFDPQNISTEKVGLRIMKERADQIGGTVTVHSTPGQGTSLIIEVPR